MLNPDMPFLLLLMSSLFISAGGYIINDYFDLHIDNVNKPDKVVVEKIVKRRWTIILHLLFSLAGVLLSLMVSIITKKWIIFIINIACVFLLWLYSTKFKKKLLIGNIVISALTAWVILVVYFFAGASLINLKGWTIHIYPYNIKQLFKLTMLYSGFAFVVTLIREVVKDLEDMHGDAQFKCETMPIKMGVPATKVFIAVWIVVSIVALLIVQIYAWQVGWWPSAIYSILFIVLPLGMVFKKLFKSAISNDYNKISSYLKLIMLMGILSMLFFKFL
jgi:4-hydroxybenzoate polyprenyltransferase